MVAELYPIYRNPTAPRHTVGHLHNTFIDLAAERGLLSLAAYLWLMMAGAVVAARGWRRGEARDLNLGVLLAVVAFNIAGLFEANWRDTEVQRLVLFLLAAPFVVRSRGGDGAAASGPDSSG
jgi:O-antigen ligase